MKRYDGKSVYNGIAIGRIRVCKKRDYQADRRTVTDTEAEILRFYKAKETAVNQLDTLYEKARNEVGENHAAIFEIHQMMLYDDEYLEAIETIIRNQCVNAEYAVCEASDHISAFFAAMEDDYMRERAADVRDISQRVLSALNGEDERVLVTEEPVILVADDLTPSETVQLNKEKVLSFVTTGGSVNSHTAILSRIMNIPALIGTKIPLDDSIDGKMAVVDGNEGCIYVNPDVEMIKHMEEKKEQEKKEKERLFTFKGKESITPDGQKMRLYANIQNDRDIAAVMQNDAEGIGLFRSEFLYLEKNTYPTEEEQFEVYKTVVENMEGKRVIIRTMDIGADKKADYFHLEKEENPAMGCRAIRICLTRPELFKTQLRALFRAGAYGKLAVMYPMITSLREIRKIKEIVEEVKMELEQENQVYGEVEQGIMIETPAAAVISDLLAKEVDFFSIGTNDLTQYLLAADRQNPRLDEFYDAHHTAVLRMIYQTVQNAHREGIWCGICGELGADPEMTRLFLAMGVDEVSVSPERVLLLREIIRESAVQKQREDILEHWLF